jgi:TPP-dependent pyruvate/acetoin dehydrogenase alpha subunit
MNKQDLQNFEEEISSIYQTGVIKGPIHLRNGNEDKLIEIFKDIKPYDYKFATWANHLEALLSGVPEDAVKQRILDGRSMAMNFPQYKFYTSAIVGGICPIGLGVAHAIKTRNGPEKVHMFIGDMTLHCGITHECIKYGAYNNLPIRWIVANNKKSVDTPTDEAWGGYSRMTLDTVRACEKLGAYMKYYSYKSKWPHSGVGKFVSF